MSRPANAANIKEWMGHLVKHWFKISHRKINRVSSSRDVRIVNPYKSFFGRGTRQFNTKWLVVVDRVGILLVTTSSFHSHHSWNRWKCAFLALTQFTAVWAQLFWSGREPSPYYNTRLFLKNATELPIRYKEPRMMILCGWGKNKESKHKLLKKPH